MQPQQLPKKNGQPTPCAKVSNSSDTANVSVKSVEDEKEEAVMFGSLVDSMDFSVDQMRLGSWGKGREVEMTYSLLILEVTELNWWKRLLETQP